jgi:hypothetical protein
MQQNRRSFATTAGKTVFYVIWVPLLVAGIFVGRAYAMGFLGRLGVQILAILLAWTVARAVDKALSNRSAKDDNEENRSD